jgi:hypothetical protein
MCENYRWCRSWCLIKKKCGNINVSFDREINSFEVMYNLHAITIIWILQLCVMADSQPSLKYVYVISKTFQLRHLEQPMV